MWVNKKDEISKRIFGWSKYMDCLQKHRDEVLIAMAEKDLCAIWEVLESCKIPCKLRWRAVKFIMEKAEDPEGPQFW